MLNSLRRPVSLPVVLGIFVTVVCLTIVGLYLGRTLHARGVAMQVARREAINLVESLALQAADTSEAAGAALQAIVSRVEADGTDAAATVVLQETMAQAVVAVPRLHALMLIDQRGRLMLDNTSSAGRSDLDFRGDESFKYHRANASREEFISGPTRSKTDRGWVLEFSRRIDHPDGRFAGMVVAQVSLDYFADVYANVDIGSLGVIDLVRDNGTLIVRKPYIQSFIGQDISTSAIFAAGATSFTPIAAMSDSIFDGVRRIEAGKHLTGYPLVIIVALSEREVLADWSRDALANLFATVVVIALIVTLGRVLTTQINQRKNAEDTLARLALVDGLTGIANRRQFDAVYRREIATALDSRMPLAVLMVDADHFKTFNDTYGHLEGDDALQHIATTIAATIRTADLAACYGGEEFAVVLPATDAGDARVIAERIRTAIETLGESADGRTQRPITVSIGVSSVIPTHDSDAQELLAAADRALYLAKESGRNQTAVLRCGDPRHRRGTLGRRSDAAQSAT